MKKTLLDMVQSIMSSMDSDQVNSISDTDESMQVAGYLRDSYYEIVSGLNLPNTFSLFQLDPSLDETKPTLMYLPEKVLNLHWIKYNKQQLLGELDSDVEPPGFYTLANGNSSYNYDVVDTTTPLAAPGPPDFANVNYLELETWLHRMYTVGNGEEGVTPTVTGSYQLDVPTGGSTTIYYRTDRAPLYWTTFDDRTILFDSYDIQMDSTLQSSKTVCWGEIAQVWEMVDAFIPPLNDKQFTLLENEAKQQAFVEAKQSANPIAQQRAHKGWVRARREKHRVPYGENSRAKTTTGHWGRNAWPMPNLNTYRNHEPN